MYDILNPTLIRDASGVYRISYGLRLSDGRYRSRNLSTKTTNAEAAKLIFVDFLMGAKTESVTGRVLIRDLCDSYEQVIIERGVTRGHLCVLRTIRAYFGGMAPSEITADKVRTYNALHSAKSASTRRRELGVLRAVLRFGQKLHDLPPIPHIELPPEAPPRDKFLKPEEEAAFWDALVCAPPKVKAFGCLALDTGARKEAIETLTWDRLSLVWEGGNLVSGMIDFRDPARRQTKKRRGVVPISNRLLPVIHELYQNRIDVFVCGAGPVRRAFEQFVKTACGGKYAWVTPHVLKHTAVSLRLMAGVSVWEVAQMTATTTKTIEQVYGHLVPNHLVNAVNKKAST